MLLLIFSAYKSNFQTAPVTQKLSSRRNSKPPARLKLVSRGEASRTAVAREVGPAAKAPEEMVRDARLHCLNCCDPQRMDRSKDSER